MKPSDHDVLITVSTKVDSLIDEVREMKNGVIADISALKKEKADRREVEELQKKVNNDIEIRVRSLEDVSNQSGGEKKGISISWTVAIAIISIVLTLTAIHFGVKQ